MQSILMKIKTDVDTARKSRSPNLTMLSTIYAEVSMIGKDKGNRETTDSEIFAYCKKTIKNNDVTVKEINKINKVDGELKSEKYSIETDYLQGLLPTEADSELVINRIESIINRTPESERTMRLMGKIMGTLKKEFGDSLNTAKASGLIKERL